MSLSAGLKAGTTSSCGRFWDSALYSNRVTISMGLYCLVGVVVGCAMPKKRQVQVLSLPNRVYAPAPPTDPGTVPQKCSMPYKSSPAKHLHLCAEPRRQNCSRDTGFTQHFAPIHSGLQNLTCWFITAAFVTGVVELQLLLRICEICATSLVSDFVQPCRPIGHSIFS